MDLGRIKVGRQKYNDSQMTDMNSLGAALMQAPAQLSSVITHLGGREDKKFPLSFMTEGLGNTDTIDQLDYEYKITTRITATRPLAETLQGASLGAGGAIFNLPFEDKWFIKDYVLVSRSGTQVRIMGNPTPKGNLWNYPVQIVRNDPSLSVPAEDLQAGTLWGCLFAPVGTDFSRGNASNWVTPSKIQGKLTTIRKSYHMSGNAKDTVVTFDLPAQGGGTTRRWMDHEEWQHTLKWKEECEMMHWYASQSYNAAGVVGMKDENGQPVVVGPGLLEQIPYKDTYSSLTTNKIKTTIRNVTFGMTDAQNRQITLFTGTGGAEEFDNAMKDELNSAAWRQFNDGKFVTGDGRNLTRTGFFTTFQHIDGHTINIVKVPLFDNGVVAQVSPKHPVTGLPLESYRMVFVDQSTYDGQTNLLHVTKRNREMVRWAVAGSIIPQGFSGNALRATDIDGASVHFLKTSHVVLRRYDTSIDLQCVAGL